MRSLLLTLTMLLANVCVYAQNAPAPPPAYETATLPRDRVPAWEMLRAANGLHGAGLQPFDLLFHYRTYDAYGKPGREGTGEYVWAGRARWFERFTENGKVWSLLSTDKGRYAPADQSETPPYPASLILPQFLYPLGDGKDGEKAPGVFEKEFVGGSLHTCFSEAHPATHSGNSPASHAENDTTTDLIRACASSDRPALSLRKGEYNITFEDGLAFQHRIVAKRITVKDGDDPVVEIFLDQLGPPDEIALSLLKPSIRSIALPSDALGRFTSARLLKKVDPQYPAAARKKGKQGTVRLAAILGTDGKPKDVKVLRSPAPELSASAIDAVKQFEYSPYFFNGNPVEEPIEINIDFRRN